MPRDVASCIRAVVRVRPLLPHETARGEKSCCEVRDANTVLVQQAGQQWRQYSFDACLSSERTQKQVFQECGVTSLLDSAMVGYSATVLAYGQTGSGKTHSIIGRLGSSNADDSKRDDGLIMRSAKRLFRNISSGGAAGETYTVSASFVEIFNAPGAVNECICDLLNSEAGNLQVRYSQSHGFFVSELCVVDCHSAADVRSVLEAGVQTRRVCAHNLNKDSSRSHALFTLYIKSTTPAPEEGGQPLKRFGKITFVDLAGSERLKESCAEGNARKETQAINKSLFTLGQVLFAILGVSYVSNSFVGARSKTTALRAALVQRSATASADTFSKVADVVADQLGVDKEKVVGEATLSSLGADSLDIVETVMALEEAFDVELPDEETTTLKDVQDVANLIESKM